MAVMTATRSGPWIISPAADAAWLVGAFAAGLALFAAHAFLGFDLLLAWIPWIVLLNGPHLFAGWTRTYLAPEEWKRRAPLLAGSLALFLVGPAILVASHVLHGRGAAWHRAPVAWFLVVAVLWAYWHAMRQHHGILRLYHRRSGGLAAADRRLDAVLVHAGLLAPFVFFLSRHPEARDILGLPADAPWLGPLRAACVSAFALAVAAFLARLAATGRAGAPRLLFLAALLSFHALVGFSGAALSAPLLGIIPVFIIPHDLQYLALVRFYNRNRRERALLRGERPDLGARLSASTPAFAACALAFGAGLAVLGAPYGESSFAGSAPVLTGSGPIGLRDVLLVLYQGFFIHHYVVDQFAWRPSRDPQVAAHLGVATAR